MSGAPLAVFVGTNLPPLSMLVDALQGDGVQVVQLHAGDLKQDLKNLPAIPDALAVGLHNAQGDGDTLLPRGFALIESIRLCRDACGRLPRRAVGLFAQSRTPIAAAVSAATGSLVRYATSHLLNDDICINLIAYRDTPLGHRRAADAASALLSGLLDTVRGQTLVLTDD